MDYQDYLKEAATRRREIIRRCKKETQQAVADDLGISRARVNKIVNAAKRKKSK